VTESREAVRPLTVRILEKEYIVACGPDERTELLDSAELLNRSMREIRDAGKISGLDRIAVMAALNLAHEVLKLRARDTGSDHETGIRIRTLRERVESALEKGQQLEL
jgi:cell division protein ZapA